MHRQIERSSQVDLTRAKETKEYLSATKSMIDTQMYASMPRLTQSTTPEKERKKYNELHSTGRVKDLLKQKKISLEKLFTKFDHTHHDEISPYKKRQ